MRECLSLVLLTEIMQYTNFLTELI